MHIIMEANQLKPAVARLQAVTGKATTIPILACISIRTDGKDRVQLRATDQEAELTVSVPASVQEPGYWAIEGDRLQKAIDTAPDGGQIKLKLIAAGQRLEIRHGRSAYRLPCFNGEDMPHLQFDDHNWQINLSGSELDNLLNITAFAEQKGPRYYLHGVSVTTRDDKLCAYASDGHRAIRAQSDIDVPKNFSPFIVGSGNCNRILHLFKDSASVLLKAHSRGIVIVAGDYCYTSKLIDAEPIDIERVIPKPTGVKPVTVNRKRMIATIDSLIGLTDKEVRALRFVVLEDNLYVCLSEKSDAEGECFIDAKCAGTGETIGLNGVYAKDMCRVWDNDEIYITFQDEGVPILFEAKDSHRTGCIMAIRSQSIDVSKIEKQEG
nr:DNA polymerase III subunit beta [uncultured Cohaesibacter sp.]